MSTSSPLFRVVLFAGLCVGWIASCSVPRGGPAGGGATGRAGTLLIVGGGLDDDARDVYERFVALASARGSANIVIASAATGPEDEEITDKTESLRVWAPGVPVRAIRRATPTDETVAAIDAATAMLFTGGDQKRITDRYRPNDTDTPEWLAMKRLLARGGVIAGCSAGDAMMGEIMLLSGGSAAALGIAPAAPNAVSGSSNAPNAESGSSNATSRGNEEPVVLGPRIGPGMKFLPWAITDSHFFERDRVGRLVAALEASGRRLGLAVGEDACVEVDLATGRVRGVSVSESLLVDVVHLRRDGLARRGVLARVLARGEVLSLVDRLATTPPPPPARVGEPRAVPIVEPGQNRQLASWRLFRTTSRAGAPAEVLRLETWQVVAWPAGTGDVAFDVESR